MQLSPEEAAQALRDIQASQAAMRSAVRAHRGHLYLWIWGCVWCVTAFLNGWGPVGLRPYTGWICVAGLAATVLVIVVQRSQFRARFDRRFLAVVGTLLAFSYGVWPLVLGVPHTYTVLYAYGMLIWTQVYVVAGIWFGNYWLWIGLGLSALIVAGLFLPAAFFWAFCALGGVVLAGTGLYVRLFWE